MSEPVLYTVISNDGIKFKIDRKVVKLSVTLDTMFKDLCIEEDQEAADRTAEEPIPLGNVNGTTLEKVIEWCEHHKENPPTTESVTRAEYDTSELPEWDAKFFDVDQEDLFTLILAANYLEITAMLNFGCKTVAKMIKGKTPEQIRQLFNIENDFTPEEEEQMRKENNWVED